MQRNILFIILVLTIRILPYLLSNDTFTHIADNLDGNVPSRIILKYTLSGYDIASTQTLDLIGNKDFKRNWYPSIFQITTFLFYYLPPLIAFKVNYILSILIGFFGIYFLIPLITKNIGFFYRLLISISFSFLPWVHIYNCGYISVIPFIIYAIINLFNNAHIKQSFFILLIYPFFCSFVLSGFFIISYFGLLLLVLLIMRKFDTLKLMTLGFILQLFSTFLSEINSFWLMLFDDTFLNHRAVRSENIIDFNLVVQDIIRILKHGRNDAVSNHQIIIVFLILSLLFYIFNSIRLRKKISLVPFIVLGLWIFNTILGATANGIFKFSYLKGFDYSRFSTLNPALIYISFFLTLDLIISYKKIILNTISIAFISLNLYFIVSINREYLWNFRNTFNKIEYSNEKFKNKNIISFKSFYDEELFLKCKKIIMKLESKPICVALGLYPGILHFNNIHTLDHYTGMYDIRYKLKFRKIIEGEINKSDYIRTKFDDYGSRCYFFSSEVREHWHENQGQLITKYDGDIRIKNLAINTGEMKKLKCNFIVSTVIIDNTKDLKLKLVDNITSSSSIYSLYIYHLE